jgi:hypothetical protein
MIPCKAGGLPTATLGLDGETQGRKPSAPRPLARMGLEFAFRISGRRPKNIGVRYLAGNPG